MGVRKFPDNSLVPMVLYIVGISQSSEIIMVLGINPVQAMSLQMLQNLKLEGTKDSEDGFYTG